MQEDLGELRFYFILRTVQEALSALCTFPSFLSSFYKYLKRVFSMLGLWGALAPATYLMSPTQNASRKSAR